MKRFVTCAVWILIGCGSDEAVESVDAFVADNGTEEVAQPPVLDGIEGVWAQYDFDGPGLFDAPFPTDARRIEGGGLDLSGFPNPNEVGLVDDYVTAAQELLNGFSLTPSVVFRFDGSLDPGSITETEASHLDGSNVLLVDVDQNSTFFRERFPVRTSWWEADGAYIPDRSLTIQPLFGTPLRESTTYACIVLRDVRDDKGQELGQPAILEQALAGEGPLASSLEPVVFWMTHGGGIAPERIAAVTVFTTDAPTAGLRGVAQWVQGTLEVPTVGSIVLSDLSPGSPGGPTAKYDMYEGTYDSPNFQAGTKPYGSEGGQIVVDDSGTPIVQETEALRFALAVPKGEAPAAGWPIVMYGHGTGGDWKSFTGGAPFSPATQLAQRGIAVMGIDQPLHGTRYEGSEGGDIINSFNFFNVNAARSNFRQSAIDVMVQARLIRGGLVVPADVSTTGEEIRFDADNLFFFGHSHGALSGALFAPFIEGVRGFVLSAAGGGLSEATVRRRDILNIKELLEAALYIDNPDELTVAHPAIALMQNLVDVTDPLTYAPLYVNPGNDRPPINILLTEGTQDEQTPGITTDNLAAAAEVPIVKPIAQASTAHGLRGIAPVGRPVKENYVRKSDRRTAGLVQYGGESHFAVFDVQAAVNDYTTFIQTAIEDGIPTIK